MATKKDIHLHANIADDLIVQADRDMLSIILRNLISNSIKFTPNSGEVVVEAVPSSGNESFIHVSVRDTGVGIEVGGLNNLFRSDCSVSTEGTNSESGTGLGLLLCKEFAEKLGSQISVESEPGKGSKFTFTLSRFSQN